MPDPTQAATPELLAALFAVAAAASFTPGPNNALLAASGANFGLRRSLPHMQGVTFGFPVMIFAVALGLGEAFQQSQTLREGLRWTGAAVMLWLGWRVATAPPAPAARRRTRPLTFLEAAAFQWVNPKAWVLCVAITAQFAGGEAPLRDALVVAAAFAVVGTASSVSWTGFGAALADWLGVGLRRRAFNLAMGAMLALSAPTLLLAEL